jgi:hypothetical protein
MNDESTPKGAHESATTDLMVADATVTGQEARRRRDRIKLLLTSMTEQTNKVVAILEEAQTNEDHLALGYASWTAYIAGEYAGLLAELKSGNRREVVGSLTSAGIPTRAIAEIVGVDHSTVVRDQRQVVQGAPPDHQDGVDRRVTGRDGKSYTVPSRPVVEPKERRRGPLPDDYWRALHNLDKAARRLAKLHADDRFMANRKALFGRYDSWLSDIDALVSSMDSDLSITGGNKCQDCDERMLPSADFETTCKTCRGESR